MYIATTLFIMCINAAVPWVRPKLLLGGPKQQVLPIGPAPNAGAAIDALGGKRDWFPAGVGSQRGGKVRNQSILAEQAVSRGPHKPLLEAPSPRRPTPTGRTISATGLNWADPMMIGAGITCFWRSCVHRSSASPTGVRKAARVRSAPRCHSARSEKNTHHYTIVRS
jgi:hypothetical protein